MRAYVGSENTNETGIGRRARRPWGPLAAWAGRLLRAAVVVVCVGLEPRPVAIADDEEAPGRPQAAAVLPGMHPLERDTPLDEAMVAGIDRWLSRRLAAAPAERER
ncbi:MAG: hypothetical protein ACKOTB_04705, partial [Planctomycetia bacterium]